MFRILRSIPFFDHEKYIFRVFSQFCKFCDTFPAYVFAANAHKFARIGAKNAGIPHFFQNNTVAFHEHFHLITFGNIKRTPKFDWQDDPSESIHFSDDSGWLHALPLPLRIGHAAPTMQHLLDIVQHFVHNCQIIFLFRRNFRQ